MLRTRPPPLDTKCQAHAWRFVHLSGAYANTAEIRELVLLYQKLERVFVSLPNAVPQVQRRPKTTSAKKKWSTEEDAQFIVWYEDGVALKEIGLRFGVEYYAIIRRAKRLGLPPRRSQL